jgi:hypothetical protein
MNKSAVGAKRTPGHINDPGRFSESLLECQRCLADQRSSEKYSNVQQLITKNHDFYRSDETLNPVKVRIQKVSELCVQSGPRVIADLLRFGVSAALLNDRMMVLASCSCCAGSPF